jgi:hypothetical protein
MTASLFVICGQNKYSWIFPFRQGFSGKDVHISSTGYQQVIHKLLGFVCAANRFI